LSHFIGVVAHADHSVCAQLCSVLEQQPERVLPCSLTQLGVERDVAADDRLKRRTDIADNAAGADDDASDETEIFDGAVAQAARRPS